MNHQNSSLLANGVLVLCSLLLALLAAELVLRFGMDPSRLVPNAPETPSLNERRNELRFLERNQHRQPEDMGGHDSALGWDARPAPTGKTTHRPARLAVAMGDSFVFGNEVDADENFVALLNRTQADLEVLNMGVPGYGIDQSYLKFNQQALSLDPDIVLFGIYVSDYERSTVAFTAGSKPIFRLTDEGLVLSNHPVPSPASELGRIRSSLDGISFLLEFVRNRGPGARLSADEFFADGDRVITHLLRKLRDSLDPQQRLILIHFPRGESFIDPDPFQQEMNNRLLAIYQALNLETINLAEVFESARETADVPSAFYVIRDGGSIGHLNPAGHRLAARAISIALAAGH